MSYQNDPNYKWDGYQWLYWNGIDWIPAPPEPSTSEKVATGLGAAGKLTCGLLVVIVALAVIGGVVWSMVAGSSTVGEIKTTPAPITSTEPSDVATQLTEAINANLSGGGTIETVQYNPLQMRLLVRWNSQTNESVIEQQAAEVLHTITASQVSWQTARLVAVAPDKANDMEDALSAEFRSSQVERINWSTLEAGGLHNYADKWTLAWWV